MKEKKCTVIYDRPVAAYLKLQGHDIVVSSSGCKVFDQDITEALLSFSENAHVGVLDYVKALRDLDKEMDGFAPEYV